jgi:hypothetical protein
MLFQDDLFFFFCHLIVVCVSAFLQVYVTYYEALGIEGADVIK